MKPIIPHARLRRLQDLADRSLRRDDTCPHSSGSAQFTAILCTGIKVLYEGCADCREQIKGGKREVFRSQKVEAPPVGRDERYLTRHCERCGALGTEIHHWAPRGVFGKEEAERWPTSHLCPGCHAYWHAMMTEAVIQQAG